MNVPCGVFWACAPGIPMPAGIWRGEPFTKTVRWAWMWNSTCSLVSQWMPSTGAPVALVAVLASGGALGTGTPSVPFGPADGAGLSGPSVLSEVSFDDEDWLVLPLADEPPEVAASAMPTAAPPTITTAPSATSQRCRRRRRASAALASAIFWRACCCLFLLLLDTAPFPDRVTVGDHAHGMGSRQPGDRARAFRRATPGAVDRLHHGDEHDGQPAPQRLAGPGQRGQGLPVHGNRQPRGVQRPADAGGAGRRGRHRGRAEPLRRPDGRVRIRGAPRCHAPPGGRATGMRYPLPATAVSRRSRRAERRIAPRRGFPTARTSPRAACLARLRHDVPQGGQ